MKLPKNKARAKAIRSVEEDEEGPDNKMRVAWAEEALQVYPPAAQNYDHAVTDLIADLLHAADAEGEPGLARDALGKGISHYLYETGLTGWKSEVPKWSMAYVTAMRSLMQFPYDVPPSRRRQRAVEVKRETGMSNADRAKNAKKALVEYRRATGVSPDNLDAYTDLISDLLHFSEKQDMDGPLKDLENAVNAYLYEAGYRFLNDKYLHQ